MALHSENVRLPSSVLGPGAFKRIQRLAFDLFDGCHSWSGLPWA
jgi:hypothetical protein